MSTVVILVFLLFFVFENLIETTLLWLNLRQLESRGDEIPTCLRDRIDSETARKSRAYGLAYGRFALAHGAFQALVTLTLLFSGVLPALAQFLAQHGFSGAHLFVAFLAVFSVAGALLDLPFGLYRTFRIETRFGFNRVTWRLWCIDRMKELLLSAIIGLPLLYAIYWFMTATGPWWWVWLFGFIVLIQLVMLWLYPAVIAPLFNDFVPLPPGELKERVEALAARAGFRNRGLYVMDASRRSGHSNAYFVGLLRPRIVLFDTLVKQMSVDEATSVLAHEIGHYQARHIQKRLVLTAAGTLIGLWIISRLVLWPSLFLAFGFPEPSYHAAFALLALGGSAFTFFLDPIGAWLSRRDEYEADRFSARLTGQPQALVSALVRLNQENLSNLNPHPWYSRWHYSHPNLLERIAALSRIESDQPGASHAAE